MTSITNDSTVRARPSQFGAGGFSLKAWFTGADLDIGELRRGEIILVSARWILIVVGLLLALNAPDSLLDLQVSIAAILTMAVVNFVLHTNILNTKPAATTTLYIASLGDIAVISAIIAITSGFSSFAFVFFYPAIMGYSLVFPLRITAYFTVAMGALYSAILLTTSHDVFAADPDGSYAVLVTRLMTFAAVMVVANMYRLVERQRLQDEASPASDEA
jgi:hypothetical protein